MIRGIADPGIQRIAEALDGLTTGGFSVLCSDDLFEVFNIRLDRNTTDVANFLPIRGSRRTGEIA